MARRKHRAKALVAGWWRVVAVLCGVLAVAGVATAVVLWRSGDEAPGAGATPAPERVVGISTPVAGGQVSQVERLVGTVRGLRAGEEVWVLIRRAAAQEAYYPASGPCLTAGEALTCPDVTIGGTASTGTFELVPVVVDGDGQRALVDYLRGAGKQSSGPGLAGVPRGTVAQGPTVTVSRRP
ncbi:hypothetical protein [Kribbella lupini]|uniref:Uncharacterized protein n=1 Tax=Kribbella lupini TaxID=291602 RepID=A0ABN2CC14_9ACTN